MNGGVLWGRPRPGKGCSAIDGWMDGWMDDGTILGKYLSNIKYVFWFFLQLLSGTFLILRRIQRDIIKVRRSSCKVLLIMPRFWRNLNFAGQIFEKSSGIKFYKTSSSGSRVMFIFNYKSRIRTAALRLIVRSWLDVLTFATRRLHACHHARAPSGGRWNCGREMSGNFA